MKSVLIFTPLSSSTSLRQRTVTTAEIWMAVIWKACSLWQSMMAFTIVLFFTLSILLLSSKCFRFSNSSLMAFAILNFCDVFRLLKIVLISILSSWTKAASHFFFSCSFVSYLASGFGKIILVSFLTFERRLEVLLGMFSLLLPLIGSDFLDPL